MWLNLALLFLFGWFTHRQARKVFGTRWSPLTIYFAIWLLLISLYALRLVRYPPLHLETWIILWMSLLVFWLGVMTPALATLAVGKRRHYIVTRGETFASFVKSRARLLRAIIFILCAASFLAVIGQYAILLRQYGGVHSLLTSLGSIRYDYATNRLSFGILDYAAMLPFTAAIFGGCYLAIIGMRSLTPYFPILAIVAWALPITARMNILWGLLLFFNAFALSRILAGRAIVKLTRRCLLLALGGVVLFMVMFNLLWQGRIEEGEYPLFLSVASPEFIRARERLVGGSRVGEVVFGSLISNYAYYTLQLAHLNFYLHETMLRGDEAGDSLTGAGSFAVVWRVARKIGLVAVEGRLTGAAGMHWPELPFGPSTYLGGLYYDFGLLGVVVFPYLLGFLTALLYFSALRKPCFVKLCVLVILYLFIQISWFGSVFNHTAPAVCLGVSLLIAAVLDTRPTGEHVRSRLPTRRNRALELNRARRGTFM